MGEDRDFFDRIAGLPAILPPVMRNTLDFLLYDWLKVQDLSGRERFADRKSVV